MQEAGTSEPATPSASSLAVLMCLLCPTILEGDSRDEEPTPESGPIRMVVMIITSMNGTSGRTRPATGIWLMLDPIYRQRPTGGVTWPMASAQMSTNQWIGSIPKRSATG